MSCRPTEADRLKFFQLLRKLTSDGLSSKMDPLDEARSQIDRAVAVYEISTGSSSACRCSQRTSCAKRGADHTGAEQSLKEERYRSRGADAAGAGCHSSH